jgi:hypothetical protein
MPMPYDWNDLDQAIYALQRSKAALPDLFRALAQGKLCALMPYHPEMEDAGLKLENGMQCPFLMLEEEEGTAVALFSSPERAEEAMKKGGVENKFCVGAMPAKQMLEVIGKMNLHASLNNGCATGAFIFGPDLMRDLASGAALEPKGTGPTENVIANVIGPADYPTDVIQPLFEILRRHRAFRAAWIARRKEPTRNGGSQYQIFILMQPRDEQALHDFNIVLQTVRKEPDDVWFGCVDENDGDGGRYLLERAIPFYTAPDFKGARSLIDLE